MSFQSRFGAVFAKQESFLTSLLHDKGRLLYYVQAVDLVHQSEFTNDKSILREILGLTNMASKTGHLMSFLPLHLGLKVKVTKKLLPPEVVESPRDRIRAGRLDMFAWTISLPASITLRIEAWACS